jgi:hypothetical protein
VDEDARDSDDDDSPVLAAMLWLPNPDSRRGWEHYRVDRKSDKGGKRAYLGFQLGYTSPDLT